MTDLELLARLILCEAGGEGDTGMRAVATVIMNRVRSVDGEYGRYNTIRDVVYAPRQFECVTSAIRNIENLTPNDVHYDIAEWAIYGNVLGDVWNALWFYAPGDLPCRTNFPNRNGVFIRKIGGHCFYAPTETYPNT